MFYLLFGIFWILVWIFFYFADLATPVSDKGPNIIIIITIITTRDAHAIFILSSAPSSPA